jgi:hypothetical protein
MSDKAIEPVDPNAFQVDIHLPPYNVPCPVCSAYALEACRDQARDRRPRWLLMQLGLPEDPWPPGSRIERVPHPERQKHWAENPGIRVQAWKS